MEPLQSIATNKIAELVFRKFLETSTGELTKKFTNTAVQRIDQLHQQIWFKLRSNKQDRVEINTISEQGIDYGELKILLKKASSSNHEIFWKKANHQTYLLMLKAVGKEKYDWIKKEDMLKFPCDDLDIIDTLWTKYSDSHFGFSSQNRIWNSIHNRNDCFFSGKNFASRVGWLNIDGSYKDPGELNYNLDAAPQGHLPYTPEFTGRLSNKLGYWLFSHLSSRFAKCDIY
ncbi:GUN4 domain-containing protein [Crocosphaera chwakensis]|uniref:Serine/threonine kinase n=1 Tax=Crocosphaera chwakensis CCY0110 TaxID=391612 RepID=A3IUK8_9CHRO|nr:GUN4 domain-containing protein [Crocosphaera chwakensis]EAZ89800.1 serine/threonine kinase [Crocosphaera chwakensis CCY0110]